MFQKNELNRLSCVEALNENINIPDVDGSVMVQIRSSDIKLIQRIGRNIRFREGHEAQQDGTYLQSTAETADSTEPCKNAVTIVARVISVYHRI